MEKYIQVLYSIFDMLQLNYVRSKRTNNVYFYLHVDTNRIVILHRIFFLENYFYFIS